MKTIFLALTAFLPLGYANAQTADEIVSKHTEAIGGKEQLSKISSLYIESITEVMGTESETKTTIVNGKAYRNESNFNGQLLVQVMTEKGGWMINPFTGSTEPAALPEDQFKSGQDQVYVGSPLVEYAAHGAKIELLGQEKVGEVNAHKLKYTNKDNAEMTFYIDPSTHYLVRAVNTGNAMGQEITITTNFSDFKKTEHGIVLPHVTDIDMGQFALKVNVKKVEVNKQVDASIFEMTK